MLLAAVPARADGFAWPGGARAAVSLAYDDALPSQLDHAIPALDRAGLRASFYLTLASDTVATRLPEWRAAAARGHELGNHTLFHQCSASAPERDWVTPDVDLDRITIAQMAAQVRLANVMLHAIDGRDARTLTVPCGDAVAADGSYLPQVRAEFVAIKYGRGAVAPDMDSLDPWAVTIEAPVGASGADLIALVDAAVARGTMLNLTFHGIGGDHLGVSTEAHEQLLAHLAAHRDSIWTDTFLAIMRHVRTEQAAPAP
ncbi:polysaccharide deacetylase family protein [Coralloluteibacterium stylophorae]|uniref:Polysaccharide deacetylase family protein n=1 Tax=Coralloluteibacterium stylophorae TaxID=1776034 RepID=A0A8J7VS14_9GAMM|nr:polysaccharide deacetylase family protein [Coralloluteibacterium stylophorae]MBS7455562.1 polysaccharide deacetylase family protein [Coralloluteibacterium stylophorae]